LYNGRDVSYGLGKRTKAIDSLPCFVLLPKRKEEENGRPQKSLEILPPSYIVLFFSSIGQFHESIHQGEEGKSSRTKEAPREQWAAI
jgi:hypothetical protein